MLKAVRRWVMEKKLCPTKSLSLPRIGWKKLAPGSFDDPAAGLTQEPFVSGVPEMMGYLVKTFPTLGAAFGYCSRHPRFPATSGR